MDFAEIQAILADIVEFFKSFFANISEFIKGFDPKLDTEPLA